MYNEGGTIFKNMQNASQNAHKIKMLIMHCKTTVNQFNSHLTVEVQRYMIYMYRYIVSLVSRYSDISHDTVQCVLVGLAGFERWT